MRNIFIAIVSCVLVTGCAKQQGQNQYRYNEVGQSTLVEFVLRLTGNW